MLRAVLFALLLLVAAAGTAAAQAADPIDVRIEMVPGREPTVAGAAGEVALRNATPGERYSWTLNLTKDYTTFEILPRGAFSIERARQVVPMLVLDGNETVCHDARSRGLCEYPLFEVFPNERVWDVDSPARVFHTNGTARDPVLRLGVPGPVNATLVLERDVAPPNYTLGPVLNVTPISFYQESRTDELAIADLQVRKAGTQEWIRSPTTVFHFLQRFPIQGLDADSDYETRFVFHDWAGNEATSPVATVHTVARVVGRPPVVTPLFPEPNGTLNATEVVLRARIEAPGPLADGGIRLFFDLKEVREDLVYADGVLSYTPRSALAPGRHTVNVEAMTEDGAEGSARWTFTVAGATRNESPAPGLAWLLGAIAAAALVAALRRESGR